MKRFLTLVLAAFMLLSVLSGTAMGVQAAAEEFLPAETDNIGDHVQRVYPSYPRNNDMSQTMAYKLGVDYGGLEEIPEYSHLFTNINAVEDILDHMRHLDNMTRGIPKLCILVGYQKGGHDWQFPAFDRLSDSMYSKEHPEWDGAQCLHYVMQESRKYHTKTTVHINLVDAYDMSNYPEMDNSVFEYYRDHNMLTRKADGTYTRSWNSPHGSAYNVSLKQAWEDPNAIRLQIDRLFAELPELLETGIIWNDTNVTIRAQEYGDVRVTLDEQVDAYNDIVSWIKNKYNVDIISECGMTEQYGYFSYGMSWVSPDYGFGLASSHPMEIPAYIMAGGNGDHNNLRSTEVELFKQGVQLEKPTFFTNPQSLAKQVSLYNLPYSYLNTKLRMNYIPEASFAAFSDDVHSMRYTGYEEDVGSYDPASTEPKARTVVFRRFWEHWDIINKQTPEKECYFYENENNQLILGTEPKAEQTEYFWDVLPGADGTFKIRNHKTGNYLAVETIAAKKQNNDMLTKAIADDGDFSGAIWQNGPAVKGTPTFYTMVNGQKVYLGSDDRPLYTTPGGAHRPIGTNILGSMPSSLIPGGPGHGQAWDLMEDADFGTRPGYINNQLVLSQNDRIYMIGNDVFMPVAWRDHEIMAYSENGCTRTWKFPADWEGIAQADVYDITPDGLANKQTVDISDGTITLTVQNAHSKTIVPAGTDTDNNFIRAAAPQVQYLGTDAETSGSWTGVYGANGYSIVGGSEKLPQNVSMKHIGAASKVWAESTEDGRGLYTDDTAADRTASALTSVLHQIVDVDTGSQAQKVSVYLSDWNNEECQTLVEVIDPVTQECLAAKIVNNYADGVYVSFNIQGHAQLRLTRFYKERMGKVGPVYVSGLFFDPAAQASETSAEALIWKMPAVVGAEAPKVGDRVEIRQEALSRDCGVLSYQWQSSADGREWVNIPDADGRDLILPAITREDAAKQYRCVVTNVRKGYAPAQTVSQTVALGEQTEYAAVNSTTQKLYKTLSQAIAEAVSGETVTMLKDSSAELVMLDKGITLDLGGRQLTAQGLVAFNGSQIQDSSKGQGLLIAADPSRLVLPKQNAQMALWNGTGYVFGAVTMQQSQLTAVQGDKGAGFKIVLRPVFISDAVSKEYFADGAADNKLTMGVRVSYVNGNNYSRHCFEFADDPYVKSVYTDGSAFALTLRGFTDSYQDIQVETYLISDSGIEIYGTAQTFQVPAAG